MERNRIITQFFVASILISSLSFSPWALDPTLTSRVIAFSLLMLFPVYFLFASRKGFAVKVDLILLIYGAYVVFCISSILWAKTKSEAIFESSKQVLAFLSFVFTYLSLKRDKDYFLMGLYKISCGLFYILLWVVFFQYKDLQNHDKESLYALTGLNGHKNLFASFLFLNQFFLIGGILHFNKDWRWLAILAAVLNLGLLFFLQTKAVWIGLCSVVCLSTLTYILYRIRPFFKIGVLTGLLICLLGANLFFLCGLPLLVKKGIRDDRLISDTRVKAVNSKLDQERLILWDKTYDMIRNYPLGGVGMGNWQIFFPNATLSGLWRAEDLNFTFQRPHNDFLWILSETGLVGLNLFLLFLFALVLLTFKVLGKKPGISYFNGPGLALAFMVGYFCISFFDFPKERVEHLLWINVILGICYYHVRENSDLRSFTVLTVFKWELALILLPLGFILTVGFLRHKGEYYTKKMLNNRANFPEVIKASQSAISFVYTVDPTSIPLTWYTGNAYATMGNYTRAYEDLRSAYKLNPYNRNILNDLASAYATKNENDSAKLFYKEASRISPRFDEPKLNLISIYINEKNYALADECLKTLFHDSERRSQYQKIVNAFK